jgi:hypothetical protein
MQGMVSLKTYSMGLRHGMDTLDTPREPLLRYCKRESYMTHGWKKLGLGRNVRNLHFVRYHLVTEPIGSSSPENRSTKYNWCEATGGTKLA